MSKKEFNRLEVLLGVQSGRLRVADACELLIDVTGWGGKTKTYDITVDLDKLLAYGLTLPQVLQVLNNSNINVGGQTVNFGPQAAIVRGVGLIHSMDQIRDTMITSVNGAPVRC